jgi:NB-ARC domain
MTANIKTEVIGQLAVGHYIIKIGSIHGAIVNIPTPQEQATVRLRPTPVFQRQPPCSCLLGREELILNAIASLQSKRSLEFYSQAGFGKSALLRSLAHNQQVTSLFDDGVISLSFPHPYVSDFLQFIWDAFYESNIPYKPTDNQIRQQIQDKQALIVLDDDELIQDEIKELINSAGNCTFILASSESRIQEKGQSILLPGLTQADALVLLQAELQRSLTIEETPAAKSLCTILKGNPIHLRLAIASIQENKGSLAEIVSQLPTSESGKYLIEQIVASLSEPQKSILDLLAVMGSVGLDSKQIAAITQISDAYNLLLNLCKRHLIEINTYRNTSRYSINKSVVEVLPPEWKLTTTLESVITYFTNWAEKHQQQPEILLSEIDAIAQILEVAVKISRWADVLRLVKAVEGSLALNRRWGLWEQVLQRGLQASQAEQDKASEAWMLHQLGSYAVCLSEYLSENKTAINYLNKAIQLRESLKDEVGVRATRHNLSLLKISAERQQLILLPSSNLKNRELDKLDKLNTAVDTDTSKNLPENLSHTESSEKPPTLLTENVKTQPPSPQLQPYRMNIIADNSPPFNKPSLKSVLFSPTGVITTGILASGGLLTLFNWHRFTPPTTSTTTPKATTKPSPLAKPTPTATATPSPTIEPTPTATATLSPIIEPAPRENPVLPPILPFKQPTGETRPITNKTPKAIAQPKQPKIEPIPAPVPTNTPTIQPTSTPTFTPFATPIPEEPTAEPAPTPTFTPTPEEPHEQPILEPTPSPTFTPTFEPPTVQPTPENSPKPQITVTPSQSSQP